MLQQKRVSAPPSHEAASQCHPEHRTTWNISRGLGLSLYMSSLPDGQVTWKYTSYCLLDTETHHKILLREPTLPVTENAGMGSGRITLEGEKEEEEIKKTICTTHTFRDREELTISESK